MAVSFNVMLDGVLQSGLVTTDSSIRQLLAEDLPTLLAYLERHMAENGRDRTALFQPQSRSAHWVASEREPRFRESWRKAVGEPGWSRAWGAFDSAHSLIGHADIRARPESCAAHRALLGLGVARPYRNRGIAKMLVQRVTNWAIAETDLTWLDLNILGGNGPARAVYNALGFQEVSSVEDMFRIDGQSVADVFMTKRLR